MNSPVNEDPDFAPVNLETQQPVDLPAEQEAPWRSPAPEIPESALPPPFDDDDDDEADEREPSPGATRVPPAHPRPGGRSPLFMDPRIAPRPTPRPTMSSNPNVEVVPVDIEREVDNLMRKAGVDPANGATNTTIQLREYYRELVQAHYSGKNAGFDEGLLEAEKMFKADKDNLTSFMNSKLLKAKARVDAARQREQKWKLACLPCVMLAVVAIVWFVITHLHVSVS